MLAQQVHGEGGRERLRVQLSAKASGTHFFEEEHQDPLGVGILGVEDIHDLRAVRVDASPYGDPSDEIPHQQDVEVVRNRTLQRPL
jgi:hypothetical protein